MTDKKVMIDLTLSLDEVNAIMVALGQAPYAQVAAIVENIKTQAVPQVEAQKSPPTEN